jgi:uncharacterized protein YifE (UPF0438 family)
MPSDFKIECDESIFEQEELSILSKHGNFLKELSLGIRARKTKRQVEFVNSHKGLTVPEDEYQWTWFKYSTRLEWERRKVQKNWNHYYKDKIRFILFKSYSKKTLKSSYSKKTQTNRAKAYYKPPRKRLARIDNIKFRSTRKVNRTTKIPEAYRRRINEFGTREDWIKNRRKYDG